MLDFDACQKKSFKFWAKGETDAVIILADNTTATSQNEKRYETYIGGYGNRFTWIWRKGPWSEEATPFVPGNFLSTSEYRPFWLSWTNQNITVGQGERIRIDVLGFKDISSDEIEINYLFVRSFGRFTVHFKYFYYNGNPFSIYSFDKKQGKLNFPMFYGFKKMDSLKNPQ